MQSLSQDGLKHLITEEGFKNQMYRDQVGLPTIGVGHLLTREELLSGKIWIGDELVRWANGLTDVQVEQLALQDSTKAQAAVRRWVKVPLTQNQFDALVSFVFNVGRGAFYQSTLLKVLNAGRYEEVPAQLQRWVYAAGQKLDVLIGRRAREARRWSSP